MKIAFALDDTLDAPDGVQQAVLTIGEKMRSMGHDVHYLASDTSRKDISNIHSLSKFYKIAFNGNVMRIPMPASKAKINSILHKEKFDVIHVQMPYSPMFVEKIILNAPESTKIIGTFHILPYKSFHKYATYGLGKLLRRSLKKINHVISVSEPARDFSKKTFGVDSVVIPNPIDLKKFSNTNVTRSQNEKIVFLGRLVPRKGAKQLIQAYARLLDQHPEKLGKISLTIAGKGPEEINLKKIASKLPKNSNVDFIGYVDEANKPALLAGADIAVFPSLSGESFGIVLLEAMASGSRLVLAGDNPGYRSVMQDYPDLLIDVNETELFARKLYELLEPNTKNEKLSKELHDYVVQFDVSNVCESLLKLYNS